MLKRTLILIVITLLAFSSVSCGQKTPDKTEPAPSHSQVNPVPAEPTEPENPMPIVDLNGTVIGTVNERGAFSAADAGIFYSLWEPGENEHTATAEYHFFRSEDRKDIFLGTLADQGYEASYARTELDGIVYTLAVTGDPMDEQADTLWLLAFDPMKETMTQTAVSEYGFPYASLSAADGKLWIMNHERDAKYSDKVYAYDTKTGVIREVLSYDGSVDGEGSLRAIYSDGTTLYVLNLKNEGKGNALHLVTYDLEGQKITEQPLDDLLIPPGLTIHGMTGESDLRNEFGMMVSNFAVLRGQWLFYSNFGTYRAVVNLENGKVLFADDDLWSMTIGGGEVALFKLIFYSQDVDQTQILTFRLDSLRAIEFQAPEGPALVQSVSRSPAGNWLVYLADDTGNYSSSRALCFFSQE